MKILETEEKNTFYMVDGVILAAGYGKRLQPLTLKIPKAIFPLLGQPLIIHVIKKMERYGIESFFVNVHYKKDMVVNEIKKTGYKTRTTFQLENELLLTGGGLKGLLEKVESENALVHNVDIIEEFDYNRLFNEHVEKGNDITWILDSQPGNVIVEGDKIIGFGSGGYTFTGVALYNKRVLRLMPEGKFHLIPWISRMLTGSNLRLGFVLENNFWVDAGTPEGIFRAYVYLMNKRQQRVIVKGSVKGDVSFKGYVYVDKDVYIDGKCTIEDSIILGRSCIQGEFSLKRSIIYDNLRTTF